MKSNHKNLAVLLVTIAAACSPELQVYTDYDRDANVGKFLRYSWKMDNISESKDYPLYYNELNDKRIRQAVDGELAGKGYMLSEEDPQFTVHYHISVKDKTVIRAEPYGYRYSPYWLGREINKYEYQEGTLIIDVMDVATGELAWRGWAVAPLDEIRPQNVEKKIRQAVAEILASLPSSMMNPKLKM